MQRLASLFRCQMPAPKKNVVLQRAGKNMGTLPHPSNAFAVLPHALGRNQLTVAQKLAAVRLDQSGQQGKQCGFPGTTAAYQGDFLAWLHMKAKGLEQGLVLSKTKGKPADLNLRTLFT